MILSFTEHGARVKTVIKLVAQKFDISHRLARDVVAWRCQASTDSSPKVQYTSSKEDPLVLLAKWEKMANASKHNYSSEVFERLLFEETKQETTWDIIRDGVAGVSVFAPQRQVCIEGMTYFSAKYKLLSKTTEAAIVYLNRFLLLDGAKAILDSDSGVTGASGKYPLMAVAICILMISSKYEEVYPPALTSFAKFAQHSAKEFRKLERTLLGMMSWKLLTSTSADYIGRFFKALDCSYKTYLLGMFILEASWQANLSLGTNTLIFNPNTIKYLKDGRNKATPDCVLHVAKPSEIALGCIILSLAYQGKVCYPVTLEHSSGICAQSVSHIVKQLHTQLKAETEKHVTRSSAVVKKYSMRRYHKIGTFKPPSFHKLLEHNAFRGTKLSGMYSYASPMQKKAW